MPVIFWLVMTIVLANAYNGMLQSDLNAPVPSKLFDSFDDIACPMLKENTTNKQTIREWRIKAEKTQDECLLKS